MKPHKPAKENKPSSSSSSHASRKGKNLVEQDKVKGKQEITVDVNAPAQGIETKQKSRSTSPSLRMGQTVGTGKNRLLLCVDNEDTGAAAADLPEEEEEAEDNFLLFQESTMSSISAEVSMAEIVEAPLEPENKDESRPVSANPESPPLNTAPVPRPVSRKTKIKQRFTYLKQALPQYKLDKHMRKSIVTTMIDLNYWSDKSSGEESEDEFDETRHRMTSDSKAEIGESPTSHLSSTIGVPMSPPALSTPGAAIGEFGSPPSTAASGKRKSVKIYQSPLLRATIPLPLEDDQSPSRKKKIVVVQRAKTPETSPTRDKQPPQQAPHSHTIQELAQPVEAKEKVTLVKPKQIQIPPITQAKMAKLEKVSQEERKNIRETVVNKAVQLFIKLEKDQITIKELKYQSLVKEKTEKQLILLKRFAMGIVEKSIKRIKHNQREKLEKRKERMIKKFQKKLRMSYKIYLFWRRCRIRYYCHFLLSVGKQIIYEKKLAEENEQYEYRLRVARRRIEEDKIYSTWKEEKKIELKKQILEIKKEQQKLDLVHQHYQALIPVIPASPPRSPVKTAAKSTPSSRGGKSPSKTRKTVIASSPQRMETSFTPKPVPFPVVPNKVETVNDITDEELVRAAEPLPSADDIIFSEDPRITRPDLAPFSTMINSMIYRYLLPHHQANQQQKQSLEGGSGGNHFSHSNSLFREVPFTSLLSAKFMNPKATGRTIQTNLDSYSTDVGLTPAAAITLEGNRTSSPSFSFTEPPSPLKRGISSLRKVSFQQDLMTESSPRNLGSSSFNFPATPTKQSLPRNSSQNSALLQWEMNADISNLPSIQQMKKDQTNKSAAYRALEKLSNLTERDIHRVRKEVSEADIIEEIKRQKRNQGSHLIFL